MPLPNPVQTMAGAAGTPAGYTVDDYSKWYQGQYGQGPTDAWMQQVGTAVGAPGQNGQYSQAQWDQAQQMGQGGGASPFFPEFEAPAYEQGPAYQAPEAFQYAGFQAPTMEQAMNDPGYQMALKQGMGMLEGSAAAKGLARTGGTLKGLMDYGHQAAAQQYGNVYNRAMQSWQANRENAANAYATNYQVGRDAWDRNEDARRSGYDRNYRAASDAFNARFRGRELSFEDLFRRWNTNVNTQTQLALAD